MRFSYIFPLAFVFVASTAYAEQSLVPTLDSRTDVCPDRPSQPAWAINTDGRDANRTRLIQQIYRAQSMVRIVEAGECSCETRFPTWEAAEQAYFDRYSSSDRNALREAISEYSRTANKLRLAAKPICEAENNW